MAPVPTTDPVLPLLQVDDLTVRFESGGQQQVAVRDVSFSLKRGELVALVGESGSGKSVTALSALQLLPSPPASYPKGRILFSEDGRDAIDLLRQDAGSMQQIRGNKIGMIFQEPMSSLNPVMTCGQQVLESLLIHKKISKETARGQVLDWFARVKLPQPERIYRRYPHQLSGGQKQRVMIAMAMCCRPSLLICDEPTTALDVTVQKTILDLIRELQREENLAVLFITHDLNVVAEIADRVVVMYQGQVVEQNDIRSVFSSPAHPYTRALLACRPVNHPRGERLPVVSDFLEPQARTEAVAATVQQQARADSVPGELLRVENLSVWFPDRKTFLGKPLSFVKAVDEVSFSVYRGETLGLVGESGCGKTTLGRALLRLVEPTAGRIVFKEKDLTTLSAAELRPLRKEVQIVFQDPYSSLNPRLTIGSAIAEPLRVHGLVEKSKERREKVIELLEKVGLEKRHLNRYPHEFSGGQRQRIVIARALALEPSFLVCDESVSALDVSVQAQVLNLLNDLKKEYGFTIVFISHDLSVVRYLSDRIMVMNRGRIEETGSADEVYYSPKTDYTRKLISSIPRGVLS